jgi:AsmA protein
MRKALRLLAFAAAGGILLLFLIAGLVAALFNPNDYKSRVVDLVKEKKQRLLRIEGDIRLSFWPSIGAELPRLWLSEHRDETREFASIDGLRVSVKVMPLFSKQVVVDEVTVRGLRANLLKRKDGSSNFDDLLAKDDRKDDQSLRFDIAGISVRDSALQYTDQASGSKWTVSKLSLRTGRVVSTVPAEVDCAFDLSGTQPKLSLSNQFKARLTLDIERKRYRVEGLDLTSKGEAGGLSGLVATVKGGVDANPGEMAFTVDGLAVNVAGRQGADAYDLKLTAPKIAVNRDRVSGERIGLEASVRQPKGAVNVSLVIPGLEGNAKAFRATGFALDAEGKSGDSTFKGRLSSPLSGSIEAQRFDLPKVEARVDIRNPQFPGGGANVAVNGAASADLPKQAVTLNLATRFDDSTIKGRMGVTRFSPAALVFDLDVDRLDVDRYAPPAKAAAGAKPAAEQPIDLSGLRALNATGSLRIGSLKVRNLRATGVRIELKAAGGRAEINPLSASLYQGTMTGTVGVNASGAVPVITVRQNLSGVSVGPLLRDVADKDLIEGRGSVAIDVMAQGNLPSALRRSLAGSAVINLADGAVKGINIAQTIRDAKAKIGSLKGQQTQTANATDKTDFTELKASFAIRGGVARNNDLSMKSPLLRLGGEGDIDVGEERMNYLARTTVVATAAGQGGRELSDLRGVTIPVRISGQFDKLSYQLDFGSMVQDLAKAKVEEKTAEIRSRVEDKVKDQVGDRLKGLFGR